MIVGKAFPSGTTFRCYAAREALDLTHKYQTSEGLARDKRSSVFTAFVSDEEKGFMK